MFSPITSISIPYEDFDKLIETLESAKKSKGCKVVIEDYTKISPNAHPTWFIEQEQ